MKRFPTVKGPDRRVTYDRGKGVAFEAGAVNAHLCVSVVLVCVCMLVGVSVLCVFLGVRVLCVFLGV